MLLLWGCASWGPDYGKINRELRVNNCSSLIAYLQNRKSVYGTNQKLLYLLDSAMIHMSCQNYREANSFFHRAEELAQRLWTKSLSRQAASFVWNEYTRPYAGEDFERAMINLLSAISYIELEQYEEALVECRRLNSLLSFYNDKYDKKNVYKEDAFARYLSGMLYEAAGQTDEAFIDYFKSYQAFEDYQKNYDIPAPPFLAQDLFRLAEHEGRMPEVAGKGWQVKGLQWRDFESSRQMAAIVCIHFMGSAPKKVENHLSIPTKSGPIKIAFPDYAPNPPACGKSQFLLQSGERTIRAETHLVEDINKIARKNLRDRKARILAKIAARAAAKQVLIQQAKKESDSEMVAFGLNIVNQFIERADTRCWRTLPAEIRLTRVFVEPGRYRAYFRTCNGKKALQQTFTVKAGETEFILCITKNGDIIF